MVLTSGYNLEGYEIVSYLGYESVKAVIGTGIFSSLDASVSDILGVRSNSYEGKLDLAEKEARNQLIQRAEHMGGNAIIGIDVDYTTFTADLMGVIVGGTIVKAEKREKKVLSRSETKQIYNMEYNLSVPFRILDCLFIYEADTKNASVSLFGKSYCSDALKGLKVSVVIETIFQETVKIPNILFGDICINEEKEFTTEYCSIKLECGIFRTMKNVSVQITKFVTEQEEVVEVSGIQNRKIEVTTETLKNIRKYYGKDAVNKAYKSDLGWVCYCGMENSEGEQVCSLCKREQNLRTSKQIKLSKCSNVFYLEEHIDAINALKDAKEICAYLETIDCSDQYFHTTVLPEIKKYENFERMYGTMKTSVIDKLNKLYADS